MIFRIGQLKFLVYVNFKIEKSRTWFCIVLDVFLKFISFTFLIMFCSLFEDFNTLLHKVVSEREKWISDHEDCVGNTLVTVTSYDDLNEKIKENEVNVVQTKKHENIHEC